MAGWQALQVSDPEGRNWTVGIRWLPRSPRWLGWGFRGGRKGDGDAADGLGLAFDLIPPDVEGPVVGIVIAFFVLLLCWFAVFPVLVLALDVLLVLLITVAAIASRVLLRRPWIVRAESDDARYEWAVVGWRDAGRAVGRISAGLRDGVTPRDALAPFTPVHSAGG